jgi:hypothetical protein
MSHRRTDDEAAWVTVARRYLPGHMTWSGFCRVMGWPGYVPAHTRRSDRHELEFYVRAARALGGDTAAFVRVVLKEMDSRKPPNMEVEL